MRDVRFINPPSYDETSVVHIYDKVVAMKGMSELFPDSYPKGRQCDRQYMYNVWNTVYPEDVKRIIEHANSLRYSTQNESVRDNSIKITEEW